MTPQPSRRDAVKLGLAALAFGAAWTSNRPAWAFPDADDEWESSGSLKGRLGHTIVVGYNPYNGLEPQAFKKWRRLAQSDTRETKCWFSTGEITKPILKTIRFPYAIKDKVINSEREQVIEHLLVGYGEAETQPAQYYSTAWGAPTDGFTLDKLGHFLVRSMQPTDTGTVAYSSRTSDVDGSTTWNGTAESGGNYTAGNPPTPYWYFRGNRVTLERIIRIPITITATPTTGTPTRLKYFIYVGYEGGGGY